MLETETRPAYPYSHLEIPLPVQNILFPNETWIELEKDRTINFEKFENENDISKNIINNKEKNQILVSSKLKNLFRFGIPCRLRSKYWLLVSGGQNLLDNGFSYYDILLTQINTSNFKKTLPRPFGVPIDFIEAFSGGNQRIIDFIYIVAYQNQKIQYAPLIPRVCLILLTFLKNDNAAYLAIQAMINHNHNNWYFATKFDTFLIFSMSIRELCQSKMPKVYHHLVSLQIDVSQLFLNFMFDKEYLTTPITLTLFDSYIHEGKKVLLRFFFTFLIQESKLILECKTADEIRQIFSSFYQSLDENAYLLNDFLKKSFTLNLSRNRDISKSENNVKKKKRDFEQSSHYKPMISTSKSSSNMPKGSCKGNYGSYDANGASYSYSHIDLDPLFQFDSDEQLLCNSYPKDLDFTDGKPSTFSIPDEMPLSNEEEDQFSISHNNQTHLTMPVSNTTTNGDTTTTLQSNSTTNGDTSTTLQSNSTIPVSNGDNISNSFKQHLFSYNYSSFIYGMENPTSGTRTRSSTMIKKIVDLNDELKEVKNSLLSNEIFNRIRTEIPVYWKMSSPLLVYKLSRDGASFKSFEMSVTFNSPHILLIKTSSYIAGAYLSDPPTNHSVSISSKYATSGGVSSGPARRSSFFSSDANSINTESYFSKSRCTTRRAGKYFGSMSTFVFKIDKNNQIEIYKPKIQADSQKCTNHFFISVDHDCLLVGGPMAAIYIEQYFTSLLSSHCDTFDSPQFTVNDNGDKILDVELYALKQ